MGLPARDRSRSIPPIRRTIGYRIPREQYELPDPGLDEDELAALRLASAAVQLDGEWGRDATVRALRKLGGAVTGDGGPGRPFRRTAPGGRRPGRASRRRAGRGRAFGAIAERAGGSASPTGRRRGWWTRGGCRSAGASGTWPASDHGRDEERLFRFDRVEGRSSPVEASGRVRPAAGRRRRPRRRRGGSATTRRSSPSCSSTPSRPTGPSRPSAPRR